MNKRWTTWLSAILCLVLMTATALCMSGCDDNEPVGGGTTTTTKPVNSEVTVLGEGNTQFAFEVTDANGKVTKFEIHTDKTKVGEALLDLKLIAGEDSQYGLYVKTVNGITVDFDKDGKYWAFYVDGDYAMSGVDTTEIEVGATYAFKVE